MWSTSPFLSFQVQAKATTMEEASTQNEEKEKVGLSFGTQVSPSKRTEDFGWVKDLYPCLAQT